MSRRPKTRPAPLDRSFDAVVLTWRAVCGRVRRSPGTPLRRRVRALCRADVDVVVIGDDEAPGLDVVRGWSDVPGHLLLCRVGRRAPARWTGADRVGNRPVNCEEIGIVQVAEAMPAVLTWLGRRGVGPGLLVLVADGFGPAAGDPVPDGPLLVPAVDRACVVSVGPAPDGLPAGVRSLGGGTATLLRILDEQLRRRAHHRVPAVDDDPDWTIAESGPDPLRRRVTEALFTLGGGGLATRGSVEEGIAGSVPLVLASGVYTGVGPDQHLLPGPDWTGLRLDPPPAEDRRVLDLRCGLLWREANDSVGHGPPLRTLRFVSATRPGVVALRAEGAVGVIRPAPPLRPPLEGRMETGQVGERVWGRVRGERAPDAGRNVPSIVAVAHQRVRRRARLRTLERIAAYTTAHGPQASPAAHTHALDDALKAGFDLLLAEHRAAWAQRWEAVDVSIPDDPAAQLAARFALFQLWTNIDRSDEAAVGARGLSGTGYGGHVFWDADVYVLPAMASMAPGVARAMVEYRLRRLPAAQAQAAAHGYDGARFPWESTDDGRDVTPKSGYLGDQPVRILTGEMEEHVTADVAWAACHYASWTGDSQFLPGPGCALLEETARYWASRCRLDREGRAHVERVIGPDEYHEAVDDNAYTNVMARWNLRRAADLLGDGPGSGTEPRRWRNLADRLVDGYDPASGRYEQFAGYDELEPLLITDVARPPVAADVLLGRERVTGSQVIKQPDVLMLHHLVPDEVAPGSLRPNLDFYAPRTAHGSSLSPAIMAGLLARAGRPDEALPMLRLALVLDLQDLTGMTAAGLHVATMGGAWQALLTGFAGVRVRKGVLMVDPVLPTSWSRLHLRFRCLGRLVRLDIRDEAVEISADAPLRVDVAGHGPQIVSDAVRLAWRGAS